jgi:hypothetical protein
MKTALPGTETYIARFRLATLRLNLGTAPVGHSSRLHAPAMLLCSQPAVLLLACCLLLVTCILLAVRVQMSLRVIKEIHYLAYGTVPLSKSFGQISAETVLLQIAFPRTLARLPFLVIRLKRALDLPMQ